MGTGTVYDRISGRKHGLTGEPGSQAERRSGGPVDHTVSWRRFCVVPRSKEVLLEEIRRLYHNLRAEVDLRGLSLVEIGLVDRKGILEVRFYFRSASSEPTST